MEYKEELVYNAIILVAKKVEDNLLHVMSALVIAPPPTIP